MGDSDANVWVFILEFIEDLEVEEVIFLRFKEGKIILLDNLGSNAWKLTSSSSIILEFIANDWVGVLEDLGVEGVIFLHFEEGKLLSFNNLDSWILTSSSFSIILGFVANDRVGVFEDLKWKKYGKLY